MKIRDYEITPESVPQNEYRLRRLLANSHNGVGEHCDLYGDDGELHCHTCDIDFVRDSITEIENALTAAGLSKAQGNCDYLVIREALDNS